jgi:hypothetical protein
MKTQGFGARICPTVAPAGGGWTWPTCWPTITDCAAGNIELVVSDLGEATYAFSATTNSGTWSITWGDGTTTSGLASGATAPTTQHTYSIGASAGVALTSTQACAEVTIQAPTTNTVIVLFGSSASTCVMQLAPGRDFTIPASNVNKIFVMSSTADTTPVVNWLARA